MVKYSIVTFMGFFSFLKAEENALVKFLEYNYCGRFARRRTCVCGCNCSSVCALEGALTMPGEWRPRCWDPLLRFSSGWTFIQVHFLARLLKEKKKKKNETKLSA